MGVISCHNEPVFSLDCWISHDLAVQSHHHDSLANSGYAPKLQKVQTTSGKLVKSTKMCNDAGELQISPDGWSRPVPPHVYTWLYLQNKDKLII